MIVIINSAIVQLYLVFIFSIDTLAFLSLGKFFVQT